MQRRAVLLMQGCAAALVGCWNSYVGLRCCAVEVPTSVDTLQPALRCAVHPHSSCSPDLREVTLEVDGTPVLRFAAAYGFRNIQARGWLVLHLAQVLMLVLQ